MLPTAMPLPMDPSPPSMPPAIGGSVGLLAPPRVGDGPIVTPSPHTAPPPPPPPSDRRGAGVPNAASDTSPGLRPPDPFTAAVSTGSSLGGSNEGGSSSSRLPVGLSPPTPPYTRDERVGTGLTLPRWLCHGTACTSPPEVVARGLAIVPASVPWLVAGRLVTAAGMPSATTRCESQSCHRPPTPLSLRHGAGAAPLLTAIELRRHATERRLLEDCCSEHSEVALLLRRRRPRSARRTLAELRRRHPATALHGAADARIVTVTLTRGTTRRRRCSTTAATVCVGGSPVRRTQWGRAHDDTSDASRC